MKKGFLSAFIVALSFIGFAQEQMLSIEEAVIGQWRELYPQNFRNLQWRGNTNQFTFQDYYTIYQQTSESSDSTVVVKMKTINNALKTLEVDTLNYLPAVKWEDKNNFHFYKGANWYNYNMESNSISHVIYMKEGAANLELDYSNKRIAYTIDNNIFISDAKQNTTQVTADINTDIVNGQTVSRNEFGIHKGLFWSPDGTYLAYYRKDNSHVLDYPLVDVMARQAEHTPIKYPMAGMKSERISLGVFNMTNKETLFIEKDDNSEKYLTNISWGPNEEFIYIQVLNRKQNHMKMNKYEVANGKLSKTLFEEKHEKYVEPQKPIVFVKSLKDKFIYFTRNNGYMQAYTYTTEGELVKQLTPGEYEITKVLGYDNKGNMYYTSTEAGPIERQVYRVNVKSAKKLQITKEAGTHAGILSKNGKFLLDVFTNTETPRKVDLYTTTGKPVRNILTAKNPLTNYNMPKMEIGTIKAEDGETDLYYRLIKPANFDPNKKYPAIVYVYGGPHAQMINNRWLGGARLWQYFMAQKGYVMLTVDNRGSANRGLEFENVIHRQCGVNEMKDQMTGIKMLQELNYVDANKIGVHGWSYGGFMTTSLMVNHPDVFKVGVAGGPVIDWKYYETMYGERYMDSPEDNPEGYAYTSLVPRATDLEGKLLIVHGGIDPTVVWQHSQVFIRECIKNNIPVDYFVYPKAQHNVRGMDRIHLMQKVTTYFDDYLK